jgi:hypothetical protein
MIKANATRINHLIVLIGKREITRGGFKKSLAKSVKHRAQPNLEENAIS